MDLLMATRCHLSVPVRFLNYLEKKYLPRLKYVKAFVYSFGWAITFYWLPIFPRIMVPLSISTTVYLSGLFRVPFIGNTRFGMFVSILVHLLASWVVLLIHPLGLFLIGAAYYLQVEGRAFKMFSLNIWTIISEVTGMIFFILVTSNLIQSFDFNILTVYYYTLAFSGLFGGDPQKIDPESWIYRSVSGFVSCLKDITWEAQTFSWAVMIFGVLAQLH